MSVFVMSVQLTFATFEPIIFVHDEQDVFPVPELYVPLAQVRHPELSVPVLYVPAAHFTHVEV